MRVCVFVRVHMFVRVHVGLHGLVAAATYLLPMHTKPGGGGLGLRLLCGHYIFI